MSDYSFIDLHIHTKFSNESGCDNSIEDVFNDAQKIAERSGKDCLLAITDHNTITGVIEARNILASGKYDKIKLISGAEFTVELGELNSLFGGRQAFRRAHVLAYGFDENNPELIAFSKMFKSSGKYLSFSELARLIKNAGGYLVLAHPGLLKVNTNGFRYYEGEKLAEEVIACSEGSRSQKTILSHVRGGESVLKVAFDKLKEVSGGILVGMERFHPDNYFKDFDKKIEEICEKENLIQTAGSDFHGYHLHTQFSVGNPFTNFFQEFYKATLEDCKELKNGLHISHLPGIELLTGEEPSTGEAIKMITGNGESVTYEQYNIVANSFKDSYREFAASSSNKSNKGKNNIHSNNKHYNKNNSNYNKNNNSRKKGKNHKKGKHKNFRNYMSDSYNDEQDYNDQKFKGGDE